MNHTPTTPAPAKQPRVRAARIPKASRSTAKQDYDPFPGLTNLLRSLAEMQDKETAK